MPLLLETGLDLGGEEIADKIDTVHLLRPSHREVVSPTSTTERYSWACLWDEIK